MGQTIPLGSAVYIRYLDHVLFRNISEAVENVAERETIGWLTQENKELICLQHDRTIESLQHENGTASGLVLLKSCILEIRALPLQNPSSWHLISRTDITRNAEYAIQKAKRKTQPK